MKQKYCYLQNIVKWWEFQDCRLSVKNANKAQYSLFTCFFALNIYSLCVRLTQWNKIVISNQCNSEKLTQSVGNGLKYKKKLILWLQFSPWFFGGGWGKLTSSFDSHKIPVIISKFRWLFFLPRISHRLIQHFLWSSQYFFIFFFFQSGLPSSQRSLSFWSTFHKTTSYVFQKYPTSEWMWFSQVLMCLMRWICPRNLAAPLTAPPQGV